MKVAGRKQETAARRAGVGCYCALALAMIAASSALAAGKPVLEVGVWDGQPDGTIVITLRLYNYAHLSQALMTASEETTTAIFKAAGVKVAWVDCPILTGQLARYPACQKAMGTTDFAVRILSQPMAARLSTTNDPARFAQHCPDNEPGCVANILYFRVRELASQVIDEVAFQGEEARTAKILGHAIAHEIGHLLLGPHTHSASGLMRATWSPDDLKLISWSYLHFTTSECRQLQAALARRSKS